jgi:hypothetical protein
MLSKRNSLCAITENWFWYLNWIILHGFTSLQMCILRKFSTQFLVKPALLSQKHAAANIGIFTRLSQESLEKFLAWEKIKRTSSLCPLKMIQAFTYMSMYALFHVTDCALLCLPWYQSPWCDDQWCKVCMGLEVLHWAYLSTYNVIATISSS